MDLIKIDKIKNKIMSHQKKALDLIEEYLYSNEFEKHALVKMPTGTGKTGVIAIASNFYPNYKNTLIVVPNAILPEQTQNEIETEFWLKIGVDIEKNMFKTVYQYNRINDFYSINDPSGAIVIMTIQRLCYMHKNSREEYENLKHKIDLIIFDEGHREPAKEWSEINREFGKKTILFTATPYRNDDMSFKLHFDKYQYNYSFEDAVNDKVIKDVRFFEFENNLLMEDNISDLVDFIIKLYNHDTNRKILIRCSGSNQIEKIVSLINLNSKNNLALGCHSNFKMAKNYINKGEKIYKRIKEYSIFVHEDMLIEGLNVPEIDILILLTMFDNSKTLVQQIGRLVRKNNDSSSALVYVSKAQLKHQVGQWSKFKQFDSNGEKSAQVYKDGEFRTEFQLDENFNDYLSVPKAANFYCSETSVFESAIIAIRESLLNKVSIIKIQEYNKDKLWVMCYEKIGYSNILTNRAYSEKTLEFVLLKEIEDNGYFYLVFYDTRGFSFPSDMFKENIWNISIESLYNLFPTETEFSHLKLNSIGISSTGIFSRNVEGFNLENLNTNINERLSYCKNVRGMIDKSDKKKANRYIGTTSSRVNDYERVTLDGFTEWSENIVKQINSNSKNLFFNRFSSAFIPTGNMEASSILIDLSSILDEKCTVYKNGCKVNDIKSLSCDCNNNKFSFEFCNDKVDGWIEINKNRKNKVYDLNIPLLSTYTVELLVGNSMNLLNYINKKRSFSIFFGNDGVIYNDETFFIPNLNFKEVNLNDLEIGKKIISIDGLEKCIDEKVGSRPNTNNLSNWQLDSIFGFFVDKAVYHKGYFGDVEFTTIICDDLDKEIADFIAIDEKQDKIILIHCKNKDKVGVSASSFQDVCGQAQKNVSYIIKNNIDSLQYIDKHINRWNGKWSLSKTYDKDKVTEQTINIERDRIVHGKLNGDQFWNKYKEIRKKANSSVEVWLLTNGLSRKKLEKQLSQKEPQEQINQLMWILYGTQEVLAEVGAELKIFCCK